MLINKFNQVLLTFFKIGLRRKSLKELLKFISVEKMQMDFPLWNQNRINCDFKVHDFFYSKTYCSLLCIQVTDV